MQKKSFLLGNIQVKKINNPTLRSILESALLIYRDVENNNRTEKSNKYINWEEYYSDYWDWQDFPMFKESDN